MGQSYQNNPETEPTGSPWLEQTSGSPAALPSPMQADPVRSVRSGDQGLLRKEGEYWTVGYGGRVFRLKDTKGMAYLAQLLRTPGKDVHALDLVGGTAGHSKSREDEASPFAAALSQRDQELERAGIHIGGLGDAGEMLDEKAKAAYRRRLAELRAKVAETKRLDQFARAEQAEEEIAALLAELSRAVGLGGRDRRAASAAERARQSVTRALKTVMKRIAEQEPALGALFMRRIKTGTCCSYTPNPSFPITWEVETALRGATTAAPERLPSSTSVDSQRVDKGTIAAGAFLVPQPPSAHRATFVGRQAEFDQVRTLVDQALIGQGSFVLLNGGAGIGKTRLALEIAEYASRQDFQILWGHCYEREAHPYMPFVEMLETALAQAPSLEQFRQTVGDNAAELAQMMPRLRRVFPDIPPSLELPAQQARRYLFQSLTVWLAREAHRVPQFLLFDDLQWAEESTLALLIHLAHRVAQLPVVIVGTYRDNDLDRNSALVRTLEELIRSGFPPVKLQGLSYEAVAQLLHDLSHRQAPPHLVRVIFEETQGNPFFVEEMYKHLVEEGKIFDATGQFRAQLEVDEVDVPDNLSLVLGRRLDQLSEKARPVLGVAAVIGRSFSFPVLESLLEQERAEDLLTALEEAQRMGLIVPNDGPQALFTFAHELVRQTLLAGFALPRRQRLHLKAAEVIERIHPGSVHERAGAIAHHLVKAGALADMQKLVHYAALAEKHGLDPAAYEDSVRELQSTPSHGEAIDSRQRTQLLSDLGMVKRGDAK
jgi:AAA ATPase domain